MDQAGCLLEQGGDPLRGEIIFHLICLFFKPGTRQPLRWATLRLAYRIGQWAATSAIGALHYFETVSSSYPALVLPAVRTRASLARSSIVIHVGIPAGQIRSFPVIRFIPGLIRTPARPSMALDHRVAM